MNKYGPDLHEEEEGEVCELLKWEDEGEDVVGHGLQPPVDGVECNRGVGCWHDPFVVRFVQGFVDGRVMETSVDEVDAAVGEDEEQRELEVVVVGVGFVGEGVVKFGVAANFREEEGNGEDGDEGHGVHSLGDF